MVLLENMTSLLAECVVLIVDKARLELLMAKDDFIISIIVDVIVVKGVEVVIAVDVLLVVTADVVLLMIGVVVVIFGATVVCIRQRFSTTTASIGQHGELPHCMDNSADNFVQLAVSGALFTMSYL